MLSSHQPFLTSWRGSLDEKGSGAMMSAMRNPWIRRLQRLRRRLAGTQDFRAVFAQDPDFQPIVLLIRSDSGARTPVPPDSEQEIRLPLLKAPMKCFTYPA
jgi:hypothetical protein